MTTIKGISTRFFATASVTRDAANRELDAEKKARLLEMEKEFEAVAAKIGNLATEYFALTGLRS